MNENRFAGKAEAYARFRPGYPEALMDYLYTRVGFSAENTVADVGAGTGVMSGQLARRGSRVICVEPNGDMLEKAGERLGEFPRCRLLRASAEDTTLEAESVDFVIAAQAFHWFDPAAFKLECRRILRRGGKVVLVWNTWDEAEEIVGELGEINRKYCPEFRGFGGGAGRGGPAVEAFFADGYEARRFRHDMTLDERGLVGRCLSSSYAPLPGQEGYANYVDAVRALFHRYGPGGYITVPNQANSFCGGV